ncbi:hypothetical protein IL972_00395 [Acinetobacter sp. FL51]|uniref:hypothetical protein n=1 Tax=Acinetobacter sp. FL51 TaxID=2777978 RepID=UPI0018E172D1|nr:hypothetical protein [Acinetobacter sp. FL51]MBI1450397.1 hypothetical protein [Acinetobacter sp. FL51]
MPYKFTASSLVRVNIKPIFGRAFFNLYILFFEIFFMWDCMVAFSTWVENNSGQIQILIAGGAIYLAWLGYKKVLEQIEISNTQTETTNEQIISLNNERVADLKINLLSEINNQIKQLVKLERGYESVSREIESIKTVFIKRFPQHIALVDDAEAQYKIASEKNTPKLKQRITELRTLSNSVFHNEVDAKFLEESLQLIFKKNEPINIAELEYDRVQQSLSKVNEAILHR